MSDEKQVWPVRITEEQNNATTIQELQALIVKKDATIKSYKEQRIAAEDKVAKLERENQNLKDMLHDDHADFNEIACQGNELKLSAIRLEAERDALIEVVKIFAGQQEHYDNGHQRT